MKGICPLFGKVSNLLNNSLPSMYLQMISFQSLMRLEVYETPWIPPCSIVFIPRKQFPFQPLITKSYRSCSGSSLFICLTFCSENHVKLTKGNISFLKLCLIWIVTSFWTGSIHLLQFPFLSWNWLYPGKSLLPQKTLLFGDFLF